MSLILDNTGLGTVVLKAPASGSVAFTYPATNGSNGNILSTDGAGNTSWISAAAGSLSGLSDVTFTTLVDGQVLRYVSAASKWENVTLVASDVGAQPVDSTLTALAAFNTNGLMVQTAADTFTAVTITGTANNIVVTNGAGAAGNPTINLATAGTPVTGQFVAITTDTFGRVTATTAVTSGNITTALGYTPVNVAGDSMTGFLTLSADPTSALHAATKNYVDNAVAGLSWKEAAVVATTANVVLATGGLLTIDGVTVADGDRVLVKSQTLPAENGVYIAHAGAWVRATDFDSAAEINGAAIFVEQGTLGANTGWTVTSTVAIVGTDAITFAQFTGASGVVAGDGLVKAGNVLSVLTANSSNIAVSGAGVDLATTGVTANTYNNVTVDIYGRVSAGSNAAYLTANQTITLTGDVTGTGTTTFATTLASVGTPVTASFVKITTDAKGRVTATTAVIASDVETSLGFTPADSARTITAGTGLTGGGDLTANRTIALADTIVTPGSYGDATHVGAFTVDQQGRLTAASSTAITFPVTSVNTQTGAVVLTSTDVGLGNVVDSLQVINAGGGTSIREDVALNIGSAVGLTGQIFIATDTAALYFSDGTNWQVVSSGTSSGTVTSVDVAGPAEGITTSGGPVTTSGTITLALANDLAAVEGLTTTGIAVRTATDTWTTRTLTGTAGNIVITNGDGVAGTPTFDLGTVGTPVTASFVKVTTDVNGRVTATTPVVAGDITPLVDATYVNVAGDTMTGNLVMQTGTVITLTDAPVNGTDATNKNYVDAAISGLSWKMAVVTATTANITLSGTQTIDGVAVVVGNRVLVKDQTTSSENGIYVVAAGAWTRAADMDQAAEFYGSAVLVEAGATVNKFTAWTVNTVVTTVGTDAVAFTQFNGAGGITAGTGLSLAGNTLSVNLGAGIAELPTTDVGIDLWAGTANALILTTDGSTGSTSSASQLALLLAAGSTGGLTQTGNALSLDINSLTAKGSIVAADKIAIYDVAGTANKTATASDVLTYVKANLGSISVSGLTDINLTAGRVTFAGTGGLLSDDANFTYASSVMKVGTALLTGTSPNAQLSTLGTNGSIQLVATGTGVVEMTGAAVVQHSLADATKSKAGQYTLTNTTTNATPVEVFVDGTSSRLVLANNTTWKVEVHVIGRDTTTNTDNAAWKFEALVIRNANAASTQLVGSVLQTNLAKSTGAAAWDAAVTADTTNGSVKIAVTGDATNHVKWVAFVSTVEVTD